MRGNRFIECLLVFAILAAVSCSDSGSSLPQPGSPGFFWSAAKTAYKAGDFVKTDEELQRIMVSDNDYTARARAWDTVISAGLAQGYAALADVYEAGARANRQNPLPYRKRVTELRTAAANMSIQVADAVHKFLEQNKDPQVLLAFAFPAGSANEPAGLKRVNSGLFVQESEAALLQTAMLQRGVVLALCAATGNPDNSAKTQELFQSPEVRVPRETYLLAAAKALEEESDLFSSKKLDLPNKLKIVSQEALAALKAIPETKETKAIVDKIQKALKKANLS